MIVRQAEQGDAGGMCSVINPIIAAGGTTAHQTSFDTDRMFGHYIADPLAISTFVAEADGRILGFQSLGRTDPGAPDALPGLWAAIATFVDQDTAGRGVGRALFDRTRAAANAAGVETIDATIRADNVSGLRYYTAIGFKDYDRLRDQALTDGTLVDRIRKRFDL